ncbi:MAG: HPr family phosphocarrier protein [Chlamydiota bacterium]
MCTKIEVDVKVKNKCGLHVRPASCIAKILQGYLSKVTLIYKGESVNARSIMSLMILTIPKNAKIRLVIEGIDARSVMEKLIAAFETRFGEEE